MTEDLFNRARHAFLAGDLTQAEALGLRNLRENPAGTEGRLLLGNIYIREGKLQSAQKILEALTRDEPENPEAWINAAQVYRKRGNLKTALRAAQKAYKLAGDRGDIIFNIGNIFKQLGELKKAEQIYRLAIETQADFMPAYSNLALLLDGSNRRQEAVNVLHQGLMIDENNPVLHFNLGVIYRKEGKPQKAADELRMALKSRPGWDECLLTLADLLKESRIDEAERLYRRVLDLSPESPEASCRIGELRFEEGKADEAEVIFAKILTANPGFTPAAANLAAVFFSQKRLAEAEKLLREHLQNDSENPNLRLILGNVLLESGKYNEAFTNIRYVLDRNQDESRAWFAMARQFSLSGKKNKAINAYRKGLKLEPDSHEDRLMFALLLKNENKIGAAITECEYIYSRKPEEFAPALLLAELYAQKKQYRKSAAILESLLKSRPDDIKLLQMFAETARSAGDTEKALAAAERIAAARNEEDEDFDLSELARNLEQYDRMAEDYAKEYGGSWNRNLKILAKTFEPEKPAHEEGNVLFEGLKDIADEYVPILDVGGIDPVIIFDEDEDDIFITDEDEFIPPPEEDEEEPPKTEEIEKHEEITSSGDSAGMPPQFPPLKFDNPLTIKLDTPPIVIRQQQMPPFEPEPEPEIIPEPEPDPFEEAPPEPEPFIDEEPVDENIFGYLDRLTSYLPSDKKSEYQTSEARLKLAALKSKLSGDPGLLSRLEKEIAEPGSSGPRLSEVSLTAENIGKTLGFMSNLTEALPDSGMAETLSERLKRILSRLDTGGEEGKDEENN